MIALDTNILIRFLVEDDAKQAHAVHARFKQAEAARERLFVPLLVVLETIWVLETAYEVPREDILNALEKLRGMAILEFEANDAVRQFLAEGRRCGADLPDLLIAHAAKAAGCDGAMTFDKKASKLPFFHLLK